MAPRPAGDRRRLVSPRRPGVRADPGGRGRRPGPGRALVLLAGALAGLVLVVLVLVLASMALARYALGRDLAALRAVAPEGLPVPAARQPVLIINPKSGGGKVERFGLEAEARRRGIEPVLLTPGDDLRELAERAVAGGADVIGMAGGDGSQALVASVAAAHGAAYVCVRA